MDMSLFYVPGAEWTKFILYIIFIFMIIWAMYLKRRGDDNWMNPIHTVILANFIIGGLYGGARMLTTDPFNDMLIRRMFAWEAWFCFAAASFYFYLVYGRKA